MTVVQVVILSRMRLCSHHVTPLGNIGKQARDTLLRAARDGSLAAAFEESHEDRERVGHVKHCIARKQRMEGLETCHVLCSIFPL